MSEASLNFNEDGGVADDPEFMPFISGVLPKWLGDIATRVGNALCFLPSESDPIVSEHLKDATNDQESS